MKKTQFTTYICTGVLLTAFAFTQVSCKKSWLDAKPDKALVIPETVQDFQAILDNNTASYIFNVNQPSLTEIGAGDFNILDGNLQSLQNAQERNAYVWATNIFAGVSSFDWNYAYKRILYANIVLDGYSKVSDDLKTQTEWKNIKGSALYFRAYDFFNLVQEFSKAYDPQTATSDLGIPLRLTPDVNLTSERATIQKCYDQIINDLTLAKDLLPDFPLYLTRPSKNSVYALLSRIYLNMGQYDNALAYASQSLSLNKKLLDFNNLDPYATIPISRFNPEIIYHHALAGYSSFDNNSPVLIADNSLYNSYSANDLRKVVYFKDASGLKTWNASYTGDNTLFGGLAIDELYLIRAECYARQDNTQAALQDLNALLVNRWRTGTFIPYTATSSTDALGKVLSERRKELIYRGMRWYDLKRLNKESRFALTLTRSINGTQYKLEPNDPKYVFPIPPDEILLTGMPQNPR